jgi:hypothetical protein
LTPSADGVVIVVGLVGVGDGGTVVLLIGDSVLVGVALSGRVLVTDVADAVVVRVGLIGIRVAGAVVVYVGDAVVIRISVGRRIGRTSGERQKDRAKTKAERDRTKCIGPEVFH